MSTRIRQPLAGILRALLGLLLGAVAWVALTVAVYIGAGAVVGYTGHPPGPEVAPGWYTVYWILSPVLALALGWHWSGRLRRRFGRRAA